MGTTRRLKELNPAIQAISFQPDSPFHGLEASSTWAHRSSRPSTTLHLADRALEIETEAAYAMAKRLAREEGLLVGISAAAAVVASVQIAAKKLAAGAKRGDRHGAARQRRQISE
jgi:cysteine synthase B